MLPNIGDTFKNILAQQGTSIREDTNILIVVGTASLNQRENDGSIQEQPTDSAIMLGHELIHASHMIDGSFSGSSGVHAFSEKGINYQESYSREELRTSGLAYFGRGDITENSLRRELGFRPRATYGKRDKWELRK